jgi:hypothetical protein
LNALFKKDAANYDWAAPRLPRRLRALTFVAALGARARGGALSLRDISELWQLQSATLDVLACWNETVRVLNPSFDADIPDDFRATLGVLLGGAYRGGRTLGELVEAAAATLDAAARPLAVALAANQLATLFPFGPS